MCPVVSLIKLTVCPIVSVIKLTVCPVVSVIKTRLQTLHKGAGEQHYEGIVHCFK